MTVSLCIRQGSKRNDDWVSVEELDWSAESQVLIPAEDLWCDFKWRSWAKNSSPNTNDLYIWVQSFHTLQNCCNRGGNTILSTWIIFPSLFPQFGSAFSLLKKGVCQFFCPYNECTSHSCLVMSFWLKICICSAGIRTWFSADQSSSSTLTQSSFLFDPCLIHRDTVMLE